MTISAQNRKFYYLFIGSIICQNEGKVFFEIKDDLHFSSFRFSLFILRLIT